MHVDLERTRRCSGRRFIPRVRRHGEQSGILLAGQSGNAVHLADEFGKLPYGLCELCQQPRTGEQQDTDSAARLVSC